MNITFSKYQGTGNDFVIINAYDIIDLVFSTEQVKYICDRKYGVGSDGLIIIRQSEQYDFEMDFYNPDGSQSFCGNGARCAVHYAYQNAIISDNPCLFEAIDGPHKASICRDEIKVEISRLGQIESLILPFDDGDVAGYFIDTGSPHFVHFVKNPANLMNIVSFGERIRFSKGYKSSGVNVNMVDVVGDNHITIRTYERGVEDETLSCGTGTTACALIYAWEHRSQKKLIEVETRGGKLYVSFDQLESGVFSNVYLIGPAKYVFNGQVDV